MDDESGPIVFLHSMWRARSTWLFARFRETGRFHCYYEPLNERLATLDASAIALEGPDRGGLRHPPLEGGYWREYEGLLSESGVGIEGFEERFAFHPFDGSNEPGAYFGRLIERSPRRAVLFKLCRSPFRIASLVERHPDARHYYLEREARRQFESYAANARYFLPMQLVSAHLQPSLREELRNRFPRFWPSSLRVKMWGGGGEGGDMNRLRRLFRERLDRADEGLRWSIFEFLHAEARREALDACASRGAKGVGEVEIVDMDDIDSIRNAFAVFGLSFEDFERDREAR